MPSLYIGIYRQQQPPPLFFGPKDGKVGINETIQRLIRGQFGAVGVCDLSDGPVPVIDGVMGPL